MPLRRRLHCLYTMPRSCAGTFNCRLLTADCLLQMGQHLQALEDYSAAVETQPGSALALFNRGVLLDRLDKLPEAVADFSAALALDPANADCLHNRGFTLARLV